MAYKRKGAPKLRPPKVYLDKKKKRYYIKVDGKVVLFPKGTTKEAAIRQSLKHLRTRPWHNQSYQQHKLSAWNPKNDSPLTVSYRSSYQKAMNEAAATKAAEEMALFQKKAALNKQEEEKAAEKKKLQDTETQKTAAEKEKTAAEKALDKVKAENEADDTLYEMAEYMEDGDGTIRKGKTFAKSVKVKRPSPIADRSPGIPEDDGRESMENLPDEVKEQVAEDNMPALEAGDGDPDAKPTPPREGLVARLFTAMTPSRFRTAKAEPVEPVKVEKEDNEHIDWAGPPRVEDKTLVRVVDGVDIGGRFDENEEKRIKRLIQVMRGMDDETFAKKMSRVSSKRADKGFRYNPNASRDENLASFIQEAGKSKVLQQAPQQLRGKIADDIKKNGLWSDQIALMMKDYIKKGFIGVVAVDELDTLIPFSLKHDRFGFVMNKSPSTTEGSHWVAVFIDLKDDASLEYYDSFAEQPDPVFMTEIKKLLDAHKLGFYLKFKVNKIKEQSENSSLCGFHAMRFLMDRFDGKPFAECTGYSNVRAKEKEAGEMLKKYERFGYI